MGRLKDSVFFSTEERNDPTAYFSMFTHPITGDGCLRFGIYHGVSGTNITGAHIWRPKVVKLNHLYICGNLRFTVIAGAAYYWYKVRRWYSDNTYCEFTVYRDQCIASIGHDRTVMDIHQKNPAEQQKSWNGWFSNRKHLSFIY